MGGDCLDLNVMKNENLEQYLWRLGNNREALGLMWADVADLCNKAFKDDETEYITESAYRKKYQAAKKFYDEVFMREDFKADDIEERRRELERAKMALRDERVAYNSQNRNAARADENFELLSNKLQEISRVTFEDHPIVQINSDSSLLVILSDWHIGSTFSSTWGEYNTDIAKDRLNQLLKEIKVICERHKAQDIFISIQGDMINNSIHKSIAITNRENTIEQTKIAIELLSSFIFKSLTSLMKVSSQCCCSRVRSKRFFALSIKDCASPVI